MKSHPSKSKIP